MQTGGRVTRSTARREREERERERERLEAEEREQRERERSQDEGADRSSEVAEEEETQAADHSRCSCSVDLGELLCFFLILVCGLLVYGGTAYRTLAGGDSGELVIAAVNLGTPHPPGFPLWTLLGHLFDRLLQPLVGEPADVAWRVGLSSVVYNSLAGGFIALTVSRLTKGNWPAGLLAAGGLLFSPLVWLYATHAEVFALNNLFVAALLFAVVRWEAAWRSFAAVRSSQVAAAASSALSSPEYRTMRRALYAGAFLCGLGLSNQHTIVFVIVPAILAVVLTARREIFRLPVLLGLGVSFALGLTPYVYLPLSQAPLKPYSWGDLRSLDGFLVHLSRAEYGTFSLHSSFHNEPLSVRLLLYASELSSASYFAGLPLALLGAFVAIARSKISGIAFLLSMFVYLGGFLALCNMPADNPLYRGVLLRFFLQPHLLAFVWIGVAVDFLLGFLPGFGPSSTDLDKSNHSSRPRRPARQLVIVLMVVGALLAAHVSVNYQEQDQSTNDFLERFGQRVLQSLPDKAILLSSGDFNTNSVQYAQQCLGVRSDVSILSVEHMTYHWWANNLAFFPDVVWPGKRYHPFHPDGFSMKLFLESNHPQRSIFLLGRFRDDDTSVKHGWESVPVGLVNRVLPAAEVQPFEDRLHLQEWDIPVDIAELPSRHGKLPPPESWEANVINYYWEVFGSYAYSMTRFIHGLPSRKHGLQPAEVVKLAERAEALFAVLIKNSPKADDLPGYYLNLGLVTTELLQRLDKTSTKRRDRALTMLDAFQQYLRFPHAPDQAERVESTKKNLRVWRDWLANAEGIDFPLDDDADTTAK